MPLKAVHLLLTYKCNSECDHCFVWSSPRSEGTMTIRQVDAILRQAQRIPTVSRIYFEGGEPFLFYPVLAEGVEMARARGFEVGIVSNAYWATDRNDADHWLKPLAEQGVADLSLSMDEYHGSKEESRRVRRAGSAARDLGIPVGILKVRGIEFYSCPAKEGKGGELFFRGRAAVNLAVKVKGKAWHTLDHCPEEPPNIERVHVDSWGNVQFCQGITVGNIWKKPLKDIMRNLDVDGHPVIGPLARGGPAVLAKERRVRPRSTYADACHLCYEIRCALRRRAELPRILCPDQVYGVKTGSAR